MMYGLLCSPFQVVTVLLSELWCRGALSHSPGDPEGPGVRLLVKRWIGREVPQGPTGLVSATSRVRPDDGSGLPDPGPDGSTPEE